jgi:hypothetical protein
MGHQREMMSVQGCSHDGERPVSGDGIDRDNGTINVYELLPEKGDSLTVTNCGTHFQLQHQHWTTPPLGLTDNDIENLKQGLIIWN